MTRTNIEESELIELQRNAIGLFHALEKFVRTKGGNFNRDVCEELEWFQSYAREVSDQVDALTDFVRHSRISE
jgi:hypothetical protein